jgi:hypothetical protein
VFRTQYLSNRSLHPYHSTTLLGTPEWNITDLLTSCRQFKLICGAACSIYVVVYDRMVEQLHTVNTWYCATINRSKVTTQKFALFPIIAHFTDRAVEYYCKPHPFSTPPIVAVYQTVNPSWVWSS